MPVVSLFAPVEDTEGSFTALSGNGWQHRAQRCRRLGQPSQDCVPGLDRRNRTLRGGSVLNRTTSFKGLHLLPPRNHPRSPAISLHVAFDGDWGHLLLYFCTISWENKKLRKILVLCNSGLKEGPELMFHSPKLRSWFIITEMPSTTGHSKAFGAYRSAELNWICKSIDVCKTF